MILSGIEHLLIDAVVPCRFQQLADVHHPSVHVVRFGILHLEVPPKTARHKGLD